jgi:N-acetylmuramoyl-L-alanine amidase
MINSMIRYKRREATNLILLHDSHTTPDILKGGSVPRWSDMAKAGGMALGLLDIGYHFIIERDGELVECRQRDLIGSHTPGHNMDSIGVCLVGGREHGVVHGVNNFTTDQERSLLRLLHELTTQYPGAVVRSHTEEQRYRKKGLPACPAIDMDLLREDLNLFKQGIIL